MTAQTRTTAEWAAAGVPDRVVEMSLEDHRALGAAGVHLVARAAGGEVAAQHKLGGRYQRGEAGMKKRQWRAAHWYQKAAEQGHAPSQYELGRCLAAGVGRRRDLTAAVRWYEKAAAQGHADAQCELGDLHADAEWGDAGHPEALRWWRRAGEQGQVRALFKLGWAYEQGLGVEQDLCAGARWYRVACRKGSVPAASALERTRRRMTGGLIRLSTEGITLAELEDMFPDEAAAQQWLEAVLWPAGGLVCRHCGSRKVGGCKHPTMPYRCRDCWKRFSVKTGTALEDSPLPLKTWVWAIHLEMASLKGVSSTQLHRDLGMRLATAWSMLRRIRTGVMPLLATGAPARGRKTARIIANGTRAAQQATPQEHACTGGDGKNSATPANGAASHAPGGAAHGGRYSSV